MSINPYWSTAEQAASDAALGAGVGSIIPGVGTLIGGAAGGLLGLGKGVYDNFFAPGAPGGPAPLPGGSYDGTLARLVAQNDARGQYGQQMGNNLAAANGYQANYADQVANNNYHNAEVTGANLRDVAGRTNAAYTNNLNAIAGQQNPYDTHSAAYQGLLANTLENIQQNNQQRQMQMAQQDRGGMGFGASNAMNNDAALAEAQAKNGLLAQNYANAGNWMNQHDAAMTSALGANNGASDYSAAGGLYGNVSASAGARGSQLGLGTQDYYGNQANSAYGNALGASQYGLNNQNQQSAGMGNFAGQVVNGALNHPDVVRAAYGFAKGALGQARNALGMGAPAPSPSPATRYSGYSPMA